MLDSALGPAFLVAVFLGGGGGGLDEVERGGKGEVFEVAVVLVVFALFLAGKIGILQALRLTLYLNSLMKFHLVNPSGSAPPAQRLGWISTHLSIKC